MLKRTFKDKELVAKTLGKNLRNLRVKKALSQAKLAELADIDVSYVGFIENGTRNVTAFMTVRFARALNCKVSDLFKGL
jgi:transcriptional regulator with XRE-family HTH domain